MLPSASSPEFPSALKARRELIGMSRSELARRAQIHGVMPRRYEEVDCGDFSTPRHDTWLALNIALGFAPEAAPSGTDTSHGEASAGQPGTQEVQMSVKPLSIAEAKAGLALAFGVSTDRIEITIRG